MRVCVESFYLKIAMQSRRLCSEELGQRGTLWVCCGDVRG